MNQTIIQQVVLSKEDFELLIQKIDKIVIPEKETDEILDTAGAMELLKCGRTNLYKHMNNESLPFHRISRQLCFIKSEVVDWLKSK